MLVTLADLETAARTIYGEARGETMEGQVAVGHVLLNRWLDSHGQWAKDDTLATACLRPWQFSAWNKGDATFESLQLARWNDPRMQRALAAILQALDDRRDGKDPTFDSHHYMTRDRRAQGWPGGPEGCRPSVSTSVGPGVGLDSW